MLDTYHAAELSYSRGMGRRPSFHSPHLVNAGKERRIFTPTLNGRPSPPKEGMMGTWEDLERICNKRAEKQSNILTVLLLVVGVVVALGVWVGGSYLEARAFNRVTGSHVSTWDAMWCELRVQDAAQKGR